MSDTQIIRQICHPQEGFSAQDEVFMRHAMALALKAQEQGEIPVGAVLVRDGEVIAEGWNQSIQAHDASAHAEMVAIRAAGREVENYRLLDTTLYVTLEPCPMCAGLLVHSRISRLVFAAKDAKTGAAGSVINLVQHPSLNHQLEVHSGLLEQECSEMLSAFFRQRRKEIKAAKKASKNQSDQA